MSLVPLKSVEPPPFFFSNKSHIWKAELCWIPSTKRSPPSRVDTQRHVSSWLVVCVSWKTHWHASFHTHCGFYVWLLVPAIDNALAQFCFIQWDLDKMMWLNIWSQSSKGKISKVLGLRMQQCWRGHIRIHPAWPSMGQCRPSVRRHIITFSRPSWRKNS